MSALKLSKSYNDEIIFHKIKKIYDDLSDNNFEFYERDGLILRHKPDEEDLIKFLKDKIDLNNNIEVLDYGGSLGSRFFSNYNFIRDNKIKWNIVEQKTLFNMEKNFYKMIFYLFIIFGGVFF